MNEKYYSDGNDRSKFEKWGTKSLSAILFLILVGLLIITILSAIFFGPVVLDFLVGMMPKILVIVLLVVIVDMLKNIKEDW